MTKKETSILKGIAVILMLIHHLDFTNALDVYVKFSASWETAFWSFLTVIGKICVAVFVFITGYGTAKQTCVSGGGTSCTSVSVPHERTVARYVKLLLSYQFLFVVSLIFAPPNVNRFAVYGEDLSHAIVYFLVDFFGCADVVGTPTYNATWWYMSLALMLIALLPVLQMLCKRIGFLALPAMFFLLRYLNVYFTASWYLPVAALGVLCAQHNIIEKITSRFQMRSVLLKILAIICFIAVSWLLLWLRYKTVYCWDVLDLLLTFNLVLIVVFVFSKLPVISPALNFIGKYSMNIFLLHTFFYSYWFRSHIYSFKYPVLILTVLLIESLLASVCIEWVKGKIRFDAFAGKVSDSVIRFLYK